MSWGYHLILDCASCQYNFRSPETMKTFVADLLIAIDMSAWGETQVVHFSEKPEIAGWTVSQLLTTSNLSMHFLDDSGDLYFDLFSCKNFDIEKVKEMVNDVFSPTNIKEQFFARQA